LQNPGHTKKTQGFTLLPITTATHTLHPAREELLREAEAQRALAELFPHLKLNALRAIQDLFPLHAQSQREAAAMH
jgi:hypothetical protein